MGFDLKCCNSKLGGWPVERRVCWQCMCSTPLRMANSTSLLVCCVQVIVYNYPEEIKAFYMKLTKDCKNETHELMKPCLALPVSRSFCTTYPRREEEAFYSYTVTHMLLLGICCVQVIVYNYPKEIKPFYMKLTWDCIHETQSLPCLALSVSRSLCTTHSRRRKPSMPTP